MHPRLRTYLIFGVTLAIAIGTAVLPWRARGDTPAVASRSAQPAPRPIESIQVEQRVQIERTLVRATEEVIERPARTDRAHAAPRPETVAPPQMSRFKRVFFGSGRHRPEPFPRATLPDPPTP